MKLAFLLNAVCINLLAFSLCYSQDQPPSPSYNNTILQFPPHAIEAIQHQANSLDRQLINKTKDMLQKECAREERLRSKMFKADSSGAKKVFDQAISKYKSLLAGLNNQNSSGNAALSGEYHAYTDSLNGALHYLQQHSNLLKQGDISNVQNSLQQFKALQGNFQVAGQVESLIKNQQQQIASFVSQHPGMTSLLGNGYQGMSQDLYYYSQQVNLYKNLLNNPDDLEKKALATLDQLPAFQSFMKSNSQLAGMFNLPQNYSSPEAVQGLQTKDQVSQVIQSQVAAGGSAGAGALQANLQSAESKLNGFKDKLNQLGGGSGDMDMPNFKPNDQKAKTFGNRLEYGVNFQTTQGNYYFPTVSDLGFSLGYRLGNSSTLGIGGSFKIGWGDGWNHIGLSSQGIGIRSFLDVKLKGTFSATGAMEYNYTTPIASFQQINHLSYWTPSGLIGITKTVSLKTRVFKKTKLSLLWDFLSFQQVPKTAPILFRIGYSFN